MQGSFPLGSGANNAAYGREAVVNARFSVLNLPEIRAQTSRTGPVLGKIPANRANVSLAQNELAIAHRSQPTLLMNDTPPSVCTSLTGLPVGNKSKYVLRELYYCAGRLESEADFTGPTPVSGSIGVQSGGSCSIRYFNHEDQKLSPGDELVWDIVDFNDQQEMHRAVTHFNSIDSKVLSRGKIPVIVKKLDHTAMVEFPIYCIEELAKNFQSFVKEPFGIPDNKLKSSDPVDRYIVNVLLMGVQALAANRGAPVTRDEAKSFVFCQFSGICMKPESMAARDAAKGSAAMKPAGMAFVYSQYDAFNDVYGRRIGVSLGSAKSGDLVRVNLQI